MLSIAASASARTLVERDVEGYAIATCLTLQPQLALKAQGDGWASIIVNRGHGNIEHWSPLIAAVEADAKRRRMYANKAEKVAEGSHPMPIAYCAEIVDVPAVRAAIARTVARMKPAYRGR